MKYIIIIGDGMGDLPIPELGGKTPLEAAATPHIDRIANLGCVGLMQTVFNNLPIGSIVANMGILGFDPYEYYPHGRASFEALAQNVTINENDLAFRCNLISLDGDRVQDFTAGMIPDDQGRALLERLEIDQNTLKIEIYPGMSYRNLLIVRNAGVSAEEITCFEPHMNIGETIHDILPHGRSVESRRLVPILRQVMADSRTQFCELNKTLKTKADMLWLWSPSSPPNMPDMLDFRGVSGGIVCGMDFLKGVGEACGMRFEHIPGANAYIDTNYEGKLDSAKRFLQDLDFVYVHINAPDEEAHQRDVQGKIKSIELIDEKIVGPLLEYCDENWSENYRLMILPDHYTLLSDGRHTAHDVPAAIFGKGVVKDGAMRLNETEAAASQNHFGRSYQFFPKFLHDETIGA